MSNAQIVSLLQYIESLNLSRRNRKWLAEHIYQPQEKTATPETPSAEMSSEEYLRMLDEAELEIKRGQCTRFSGKESLHAWLNTL